jgi:predicted porin
MKKSIIAIAVSSAAFAAVSVHAAEGSTVDVYGNIQYAYTDKDAGSDFVDNGSTIGLMGETKINDDLTAFFKYELEFNADQKENHDGRADLDRAFVGLKGNFGKVQVGSFDTIYSDAIQDSIDSFEQLGFTGADGSEEGDTIAYFSPSMNGFEVQVAAQVKGDAIDEDGAKNNDFDGTAAMAVVKYSTGNVSVALGHDTSDNTATNAKGVTGLSVTLTPMEALALTAKFETKDSDDVFGLNARYGYGAGDVYASAQVISPDGGDDYNEFAAGVTYSLASNVYVFGEVGSFENDSNNDTDTQTAVGVYYGF